MKAKITQKSVEAATPKEQPYELHDTSLVGFVLRVQPSGTKSFIAQWRRGRRKTLGRFPVMTVATARQRAMQVLAEAAEHGEPQLAKPADGATLTLRAYIENEYRPWAAANRKSGNAACNRILSAFAKFRDKPLEAITASAIEKWRTKRLEGGVTNVTVNRDIACLKSSLSKARAWGILDKDMLADVKLAREDHSRVRYLTDDENKRLREALAKRDAEGIAARARYNQWRSERHMETLPVLADGDYRDHLTPAVLVSLNTGLRRGELTQLDWTDINFKDKVLTVRAAAAKSGKARHIPLNKEAVQVLKQWQQQTGDEGRVFAFESAKKSWQGVLDDAEIKNLRWHDLRHDFASQLVMAGVDLNTVRQLLGHADLKMTLRYAHLAPSHLAAAVERLGGSA